jgi:hypothetical protein
MVDYGDFVMHYPFPVRIVSHLNAGRLGNSVLAIGLALVQNQPDLHTSLFITCFHLLRLTSYTVQSEHFKRVHNHDDSDHNPAEERLDGPVLLGSIP